MTATADPAAERRTMTRLCVVVVMTQPFADQIPLLREIYADRFSHLLFLIPFERVDAPDVVTVYRGPYARAGYLTDALPRLAAIDCDGFLVVDHELLLNPLFDEASLLRAIPLGEHEGFYPAALPLPDSIGGWSRYFGLLPKMAFPKSLLFGSGIEREVLAAYLPEKHEAVRRLQRAGVPFRTEARLDRRTFGGVIAAPSRVLLHGESAALNDGTPAQREADRLSLAVERGLVEAMSAAIHAQDSNAPPPSGGSSTAVLDSPVAGGSVSPCIYILPKSRLEAFAHHAGVASAANLDADLVVPTLLYILCDKVWTAADWRLSVRGLTLDPDVSQLADPRVLAVHPVQLARYAAEPARGRLLGELARLRRRQRRRRAVVGVGFYPMGLDGTLQGIAHSGWHRRESWGRWTSQPSATLRFWLPKDSSVGALRIGLVVPVHPRSPGFKAILRLNGGVRRVIRRKWPEAPESELIFERGELNVGGMNRVEIECEAMVKPLELDPTNGDRRRLGLGIAFVEFVDRAAPDFAAPIGPLPPVGRVLDMLSDRRRAMIMDGWHVNEVWGRWAKEPYATVRFRVERGATVLGLRVFLGTPISARATTPFSGYVRLNGGVEQHVVKRPGDPDLVELVFPAGELRLDGENLLEVVTETIVRPIDVDPGCGDDRTLGFSLHNIGLVTPALDALRLPSSGWAAGHDRFHDEIVAARQGGPATPIASLGVHPILPDAQRSFLVTGWHGEEAWGRWAAARRATLQFWQPGGEPFKVVRLVLRAPPRRDPDDLPTGRARLNGGGWVGFAAPALPEDRLEVAIPAIGIAIEAVNWIEIVYDQTIYPWEVDPETTDARRLGFGIVSIEFA